MKKLLPISAILIVVMCCAGMMTGQNDASRKKARYFYVQGVEQEALGNEAEAYEFYTRALAVDPDYAEAAYSLSTLKLGSTNPDLLSDTSLSTTMSLLKRYVDLYPTDYSAALYYAYVAGQLGDMEETINVYERTDSLFPGKEDVLVPLSTAYLYNGDVENGIRALDRLEKVTGVSPQIAIRKMEYYMYNADTVGAVSTVKSLMDAKPKDPISSLMMASLYEMTGEKDSILPYLLRAEQLDPERGSTKLSLAQYYAEQGDSVNYDLKMFEALMSEDLDVDRKVQAISTYLQKMINDSTADTSRGDRLFEVLNKQMPYEPEVVSLSGRYNAAKGDYVAAIEETNRAIALNPTDMDGWGRLISYYGLLEDYDNVLASYNKMKETINPTFPLAAVASSVMQIGEKYDEAIGILEDFIRQQYPSFPVTEPLSEENLLQVKQMTGQDKQILASVYNMIGDIYHAKQDLPSTYATYDNALTLMPNNASVLNNYAYFYTIYGGDLNKAYEMSGAAIRIEPENPTYLDTYAWVLFKKKEYLQAKVYLSQAIKLAEEDGSITSELYDHYGDVLFFLNMNADESVPYWEKALNLDAENEVIKRKVEHKTYYDK